MLYIRYDKKFSLSPCHLEWNDHRNCVSDGFCNEFGKEYVCNLIYTSIPNMCFDLYICIEYMYLVYVLIHHIFMYIHIYIYIYMCMYICIYIYAYIHIYIYMYMCMYMYIILWIDICLCTYSIYIYEKKWHTHHTPFLLPFLTKWRHESCLGWWLLRWVFKVYAYIHMVIN